MLQTSLAARLVLVPLCLLALGVFAISPAIAQRAAQGILQPTADVAAGDTVESIEDNPAGLGWGDDFELAYTFVKDDTNQGGTGHGFYLGVGGLDPYHTALGLQFLDQPSAHGNKPVKVSWGHSIRAGSTVSFGAVWHSFVADGDPALDELSTWDVGLQLRPSRWIAAGVTVTDLTTPKLGEIAVERGYDLGLALRPGTEALTISGAVSLSEDTDVEPWYGGRLALELWGGFALAGRYDTGELVGDSGAHRVHRVMVGLTDQIIGGLGVGLFGFARDASDGNQRDGIAVTARLSSTRPMDVPYRRTPVVVEMELGGPMPEYRSAGMFGSGTGTPYLDTLLSLRSLADRDDVDGILLSISDPKIGWARAHELRTAVAAVRASGKRVFAYVPFGDTRAYSLAVAAERVYTAPAGGLLLTGLRGEMVFVNQALRHLGINAQFVAIGQYKSAPETFTHTQPSDAAREVEDAILDDLYGRIVKVIADGRGMTEDVVRTLIDEGPYTPGAAKEKQLVDGVIHYDEFEGVFREALGHPARFAPLEEVLDTRDPRWGQPPAIGVLYAVGTITDGESVSNPFTGSLTVGAETFILAARALREDPNVKSVVLRVDSPGGSVTAADAMWRELSRLAEAKPLFVTMGDIAASGGYYVAAPGRRIFAGADTITGSIGIFVGKFDLSGLYWMLGIHKEVFKRGARADLLSEAMAWNDEQLEVVRGGMQAGYDLFVSRVAAGRESLDGDAVKEVAQGRVWTGAQAKTRKLVDENAGFLAAIDAAAQAVGLDDDEYELRIEAGTRGFATLSVGLGSAWSQVAEALGLTDDATRPTLPMALRALAPLLDHPLLHFGSGQQLALLPFTLTFGR